MGRREAQKIERRQAMLVAARRLFEKQGYAGTTFDEIAAAAGVGVATVYKYFTSKQGIVTELLEPDLQRILGKARRVIERPPVDPGKSMVKLLSAYSDLGGDNWASRELLRLTVFPGLDNEGDLTAFVRRADFETQRQISALLRHHQSVGRLDPRLPVADATAVIFALLNQHFGEFLFDPASSFPHMFANLSRRVQLVFADWGAPHKGRSS
jgi:AcrR family transcriptional regulator